MHRLAVFGVKFKKKVDCPECQSPEVIEYKKKRIKWKSSNCTVPMICTKCEVTFTANGVRRHYGN